MAKNSHDFESASKSFANEFPIFTSQSFSRSQQLFETKNQLETQIKLMDQFSIANIPPKVCLKLSCKYILDYVSAAGVLLYRINIFHIHFLYCLLLIELMITQKSDELRKICIGTLYMVQLLMRLKVMIKISVMMVQ